MDFEDAQHFFEKLGFELFVDFSFIDEDHGPCPIRLRDKTGMCEDEIAGEDIVYSYSSMEYFWECWKRVMEDFRADEWFVGAVLQTYFDGDDQRKELILAWACAGPCDEIELALKRLEQESKNIPFYEGDDWRTVLAELIPLHWGRLESPRWRMVDRIKMEEKRRLSNLLPPSIAFQRQPVRL